MKSLSVALILALFMSVCLPASLVQATTDASTMEGEIVLQDPSDSSKTISGQMFFPNPLDMMGQGIESVLGPIMDRMLEAMQKILDTILALSDDIGQMADRIGEMADRIGDFGDKILAMADKIGLMADRIVEVINTMAGSMESAMTSQAPVANTSTVLLSSPAMNEEVSRLAAPVVTISSDPGRYLLYASTSKTFGTGDTMSMLVSDANSLDEAWQQAVEIAEGNSLYLAVKGIDEADQVSSISNGVQVTLVD